MDGRVRISEVTVVKEQVAANVAKILINDAQTGEPLRSTRLFKDDNLKQRLHLIGVFSLYGSAVKRALRNCTIRAKSLESNLAEKKASYDTAAERYSEEMIKLQSDVLKLQKIIKKSK